MSGQRGLTLVVVVLGVLLMAPTVGDTGGCGQTATLLDREIYALARKQQDCKQCQECGLDTARCQRACDPRAPSEIVLPPTCRPLYRDGVVCLRALAASSCETFAAYVDDDAPTNPSECDFCRVPPPAPPPSFGEGGVIGDGSTP